MSLLARNPGDTSLAPENNQDSVPHVLPRAFTVEIYAKGALASAPVVDRIRGILSKPELVEALSAITAGAVCSVVIEGKQGTREPMVSLLKPGQMSIVVGPKAAPSEGEVKRIERAITAAVFVSLAFTVAQSGVRQGRLQESQNKLLGSIAELYTGADSSRSSSGIVGELLSELLRDPGQRVADKKNKHASNPHREEMSQRLKRLLSQLRDRPDCATPEKAEAAAQAILHRTAGARVAAALLDDYKDCQRVTNTALNDLLEALREQCARRLVVNNHRECEAFLEVFRAIHAELARGGGTPDVPFLATKSAEMTRESAGLASQRAFRSSLVAMVSETDFARSTPSILGTAPPRDFQSTPTGSVFVGPLAEEIRELATLMAFNRELHVEHEEQKRDLLDHVDTILNFAPGLAQTLLAIRAGDETADPTVLEELLKTALALRLDPSGEGIWYHDLLTGGCDIPPPERRNPDANSGPRAIVFLNTLRFLHAWQHPQETTRAELLQQNESFVGLFVGSCAQFVLAIYGGQCRDALQGQNDSFVTGADLVFSDLAALEANLPYMTECMRSSAGAKTVRSFLQHGIDSLRQAMNSLIQLHLDESELLKQAPTFDTLAVHGPLTAALQEANQKLRERVQQYAQGLTSEAEAVLEQLLLQESAAGLIEHSRKLLDVVRLAPSTSEHRALAETIDTKVRDFIKILNAGYGDDIQRICEKIKGSTTRAVLSNTGLSQPAAPLAVSEAVSEVEYALHALHLMVRELRLIREGLSDYKDILPTPQQTGDSSSGVRLATLGELASLLIDRHTSTLARALRHQPDLLQSVREKLRRDLGSNDFQVQARAKQVQDGLSFVRARGRA